MASKTLTVTYIGTNPLESTGTLGYILSTATWVTSYDSEFTIGHFEGQVATVVYEDGGANISALMNLIGTGVHIAGYTIVDSPV